MNPVADEQAVFGEALLCATPEARAAFLDAACGNDAALRRRVEVLLEAAAKAGDFLEEPPDGLTGDAESSAPADELSEKPGDRIGRYKLLEKIGEGGSGAVYMAEQDVPVRRRVALKVLKAGMDTRAVIARFEAERQALALMDHPNIAKVLDGGATLTGRPFFVMELVRGVPITEYCDEAKLPTAARLRLFVQVCHAVQHAHQKGIIHRDLKPSNILVTVNDGVAVPRIIDFGIAKATGQRLTDKTLFTQFHAFIGTPAYTSPEQAEMSSVDIDTRSDIYSLGVLLYELLTGRTPFDGGQLVSAGLDEMRRIIRDTEPPRPSNRLATLGPMEATALSGKRKASVPELAGDVRGDLDWIVMKCLEKDRSRRYETANGLAADVRRHLDHEPILARPPSQVYRFRKLVRRNKVTVAATAAVAIALLAGTAVSIWQAVRAQRGEALANAALADLRASAPAFAAQARGFAAKGEFVEAIDKLDYALKLRPDSIEYLLAKANLLESRLQFAGAIPLYREVLRLNRNDTRAQTNLRLCERLDVPAGARPPTWHDALCELYLVMLEERRSNVELEALGDMAREHTKNRIRALEVLAGHALEDRMTDMDGNLINLNLRDLPISDLKPLQGLLLGALVLGNCPVQDIRPVERLPLVHLNLGGTRVLDIEPLKRFQSLQTLTLQYTAITDLSPLQGLPIWWLDLIGTAVADLAPLRGMPLKVLRVRNTRVSDLSPLAGMPLEELDCTGIPAADFLPLADCKALDEIYLSNTALNNLEMLRGRKLNILRFDNTAVRDLSPVAGMPLHTLRFFDTPVLDVTPLLQCPTLGSVGLPRGVRNVEALRAVPSLRLISFERDKHGNPAQTAADFWKAQDAQRASSE